MSPNQRYWIAIALIVLTLLLLWPGLTKNALTIRGVIDLEGVGVKLDELSAAQIPPEEMDRIRPFLNPATIAKLDDANLSQLIGRVVNGIVRGKLVGARLENGADTVYVQEQTILVTIRYLFENGGYMVATLLFLFSVCIPIGKVIVFLWAIHARRIVRERLLSFINVIGKWSMADVFVVAIYAAYLGAKSSIGVGQPIHFETSYGPGFYWFTAYCLVSLASQQVAVALMRTRNDDGERKSPA